jgi:DNA (cytosine-5)-methyltransferase 1
MRLLDLFCGAGGAAMGYHRAGFTDIVGVDHKPMKRYPFEFVQADALEYLAGLIESGEIAEFDLIHTSPPCQFYSQLAPLSSGAHPDLVGDTRLLLLAAGKPYVIENVPGAPLDNPLMLCGSMFGLRVQRHRLFECRPVIWFPPAACNHYGKSTGSIKNADRPNGTVSLLDRADLEFVTVVGNNYLADEGRAAMGIDWMVKKELSQAIPPAYTEFIGKRLVANISALNEAKHLQGA